MQSLSRTKKIVLVCLIVCIGIGMFFSYQHMRYLSSQQFGSYPKDTNPFSPKIPFLKAGTAAPDFVLEAFPPRTIRLSDFRRKKNVILAFYPADCSLMCTREMCALSNDLDRFKSTNTEVLGISCNSIKKHEKFSSDYGLTVTLLSDPDGTTAQAYGVKARNRMRARRVLFVIDKQGIIRHVVVGVPNDDQLLAMLRSLH